MQRYAWKARIAEGMAEEYIRRHKYIWPEMTQMLKDAGIHNYSIWRNGNELFAYYECDLDYETSLKIQMESETGQRWNQSMEGILVLEEGMQGPLILEQVFLHP